jgi:hypothetical protein
MQHGTLPLHNPGSAARCRPVRASVAVLDSKPAMYRLFKHRRSLQYNNRSATVATRTASLARRPFQETSPHDVSLSHDADEASSFGQTFSGGGYGAAGPGAFSHSRTH